MASGLKKMTNGKSSKQTPLRTFGQPTQKTSLMKIVVGLIFIIFIVLVINLDVAKDLSFNFKYLSDRSSNYGVKVVPATLDDAALAQLPAATFSYLAMIDAGSSGCRAHVYRYGKLGSQDGPLYLLPQHDSKKVKPGLSSFSDNPMDAGASLAGLVDFIKTQVPAQDWAMTPLWLKATAGLRMLPVAKSDAVLNSVRGFLSDPDNSPFLFRPPWASVISGNEEGGFGWIAFNYLKRIIGPKKDTSKDAGAPYAVIEMGGASAQVSQAALTREEVASVPLSNRFQFDIEGEAFTLYTHSYLGYGAEQAREGVSRYILDSSDRALVLQDPCINKGFIRAVPRKEAYEGPLGVNVTGGADGENCVSAVSHIFTGHDRKECPTAGGGAKTPLTFECTFQPAFVSESENILLFENFFYMASALAVQSVDKGARAGEFPLVTTADFIKSASKSFCEKDWGTMEGMYPKDKQDKENNLKMCFISSYAYSFLTTGLGISASKSITTQKEVGAGVEIEWALGAAYKEASDFLKRSNLRPN